MAVYAHPEGSFLGDMAREAARKYREATGFCQIDRNACLPWNLVFVRASSSADEETFKKTLLQMYMHAVREYAKAAGESDFTVTDKWWHRKSVYREAFEIASQGFLPKRRVTMPAGLRK